MPLSISAHFVYVLNAKSNDISAYSISATSGALTPVDGSPFATGSGPYAMSVTPSGSFAYVSNAGDNTISAFAISGSSGSLSAVAGSPFLVAPAVMPSTAIPISPVAIDPSGAVALVTNVNAPQVDVIPGTPSQPDNFNVYTIATSTGALQPAAGSPYTTGGYLPVAVSIAGSGKFVYVLNEYRQLGSEGSSITTYSLDAPNASLTPISGSPFLDTAQNAGVLSLATDPAGAQLYISCAVSCIDADYLIDDSSGMLTQVGTMDAATLTAAGGISTQAFLTTASGEYAYAINTSGVCGYAVGSSGGFTQVNCVRLPGSNTSGSIADADPLGSFLFVLNASSNAVTVYSVDASTGALAAYADDVLFTAGTSPSAMAIDAKGEVLYVANSGSNDVSVFTVNRTTGVLTAVAGSPFAAGTSPGAIILR